MGQKVGKATANHKKARVKRVWKIGMVGRNVDKNTTGLPWLFNRKFPSRRLRRRQRSFMKTKRKFPADYINRIILGDCLDVMKQIPDGSIDLVITSPPHNLKNSTGNGMKDGRGGKWSNAALINGYDNYDDNMPYDKYVVWQRNCLAEMLRIIPDHGAIFYNHKWRGIS